MFSVRCSTFTTHGSPALHPPIAHYARLGLVHHMLYPDCAEHPDQHVRTLKALAARPDIETFDCCLPYDAGARAN